MNKDIKLTLKAIRVNSGMNQAQWAQAIGASKASIYNWENGKADPSVSTIRKISELSGIPMDNIFIPTNLNK